MKKLCLCLLSCAMALSLQAQEAKTEAAPEAQTQAAANACAAEGVQDAIKIMQAALPAKIDEMYSWEKVECQGNSFTFTYKLTDQDGMKWDDIPAEIFDQMKDPISKATTQAACESQEMQQLFAVFSGEVKALFNTSSGKTLLEFSFSRDDCKAK